MRFFAIGLLVACSVVGAPAMASESFKEGHRINSYYSSAQRDQVSKTDIKLTKGDVKNVQTALRTAGYKPGKIDGIYGRETKAAVKKFQKDRNLAGAGKVNALTLGALRVSVGDDFDHKLGRNYN